MVTCSASSKISSLVVTGIISIAMSTACFAQASPLQSRHVDVHVDSGVITVAQQRALAGADLPAPGHVAGAQVLFADVVQVPNGRWLRLEFGEVVLSGSVDDGTGSFVRITSLLDGAYQVLNEVSLRQWGHTSAYFNGDAVLVELLAYPAAAGSDLAGENRVTVSHVLTSMEDDSFNVSICDGFDDRVLTTDPRDARSLPGGCTSWLFNDRHYCLLSAGHCAASTNSVVEFNVPEQAADGGWIFAHPDHQYAIDASSKQTLNNPCTNDWSYFGAFPNSNTGLTMLQAQGDSYQLASAAPPASGQELRIRGYGTTSSPVPPSWNRAQKEHHGPLVNSSGTTLGYRVDTTGGNSGSAIFDMTTGTVIGIHTCGGCFGSGGTNTGTAIHHSSLQNALAQPQGVCAWPAPICSGDCNGDMQVDVSDLLILLGAWGECVGCTADLDGNGIVDASDLLGLLEAWGACS